MSHIDDVNFFQSDLYSFEKPLGVIMSDGALWKDQRKFMMKSLREMGSGKAIIERHILDEIFYSFDLMRDQLALATVSKAWLKLKVSFASSTFYLVFRTSGFRSTPFSTFLA